MQKFEWCGRSPIEPFNPGLPGRRERTGGDPGAARRRGPFAECAQSSPILRRRCRQEPLRIREWAVDPTLDADKKKKSIAKIDE